MNTTSAATHHEHTGSTGTEAHQATTTASASAAQHHLSASAIAHELRAPLRHIQAYASMAAEAIAEGDLDEALALLARVDSRSTAMNETITGMMARPAEAAPRRREGIDLATMAHEIIADLREGEPGRDVRFRCLGPLAVAGDPKLLQVVLRNLLENAWKYSAERQVANITMGVRRSANGTREFFVADDGAGFPDDGRDPFQPFQRLHTEDRFQGTGIGLSTVAEIIRQHGGEIRGESSPGQGATFVFTLPR